MAWFGVFTFKTVHIYGKMTKPIFGKLSHILPDKGSTFFKNRIAALLCKFLSSFQ